ncbi:hypothetical protein [Clostridia bacterium UC5.1-1D1]|uniref:hypothetical protein n=1 Tax=Agathobaculum massiliense TaxID=3014267 RepID=UPI0006C805E9
MNENQQPLQDEENTAKENQAAAPAETGEPEQPESPAENRVFGMPRTCFRGTALGVAFGFLLCGFAGILFDVQLDSTMCVIVCAAAGYLISRMVYKKRGTDASQNSK